MFSGSARDNFAPQGTIGNVWRHFWLSQLGRRDATEIYGWKPRHTAQHPTVHRTAPQWKVMQHEMLPAQAEKLYYPLHPWLFISVQPYPEFSMYSSMANRTFNCGCENILFISFFLLRCPVFFYAKVKLATSSFSLHSPRAKLRLSSDSSILGLSRALRRVSGAPWGLRYTLRISGMLA